MGFSTMSYQHYKIDRSKSVKFSLSHVAAETVHVGCPSRRSLHRNPTLGCPSRLIVSNERKESNLRSNSCKRVIFRGRCTHLLRRLPQQHKKRTVWLVRRIPVGCSLQCTVWLVQSALALKSDSSCLGRQE